MSMILPPPFSVSLQCPLLPTLSFKNTVEHTKSSQFCSYVHGRGAIRWLRGALPVATFSLGNSSSVNSLEVIFPTFAGTLTDVILCRFCSGNMDCCEFIYVIALPCPEDSISPHSFLPSGFCILSSPFSSVFPKPWPGTGVGDRCPIYDWAFSFLI